MNLAPFAHFQDDLIHSYFFSSSFWDCNSIVVDIVGTKIIEMGNRICRLVYGVNRQQKMCALSCVVMCCASAVELLSLRKKLLFMYNFDRCSWLFKYIWNDGAAGPLLFIMILLIIDDTVQTEVVNRDPRNYYWWWFWPLMILPWPHYQQYMNAIHLFRLLFMVSDNLNWRYFCCTWGTGTP